jgi:hypothetical protein
VRALGALVVLIVGGNGLLLFLLAVRYWLELRARRRGFVAQGRGGWGCEALRARPLARKAAV